MYTLGVLLYVLLAGEPPFKVATKSPLEIARIVCEQSPTRPSAALAAASDSKTDGKLLQGDLDNIVLKALRKEPERRYVSVEALSDDVRRYLEGYPVKAVADSRRYRAGKFVSRHKAAVTVGGGGCNGAAIRNHIGHGASHIHPWACRLAANRPGYGNER